MSVDMIKVMTSDMNGSSLVYCIAQIGREASRALVESSKFGALAVAGKLRVLPPRVVDEYHIPDRSKVGDTLDEIAARMVEDGALEAIVGGGGSIIGWRLTNACCAHLGAGVAFGCTPKERATAPPWLEPWINGALEHGIHDAIQTISKR